jgi:hypothetical protein
MTKELSATGPVVREAQSQENYDPMAKQKAAAKLSRIPIKVMPSSGTDQTRGGTRRIFTFLPRTAGVPRLKSGFLLLSDHPAVRGAMEHGMHFPGPRL